MTKNGPCKKTVYKEGKSYHSDQLSPRMRWSMKGMTVLLAGIIVTSLSLGCAQTKIQVLPSPLSNRPLAEWVSEDHRIAAVIYTQETSRLEAKVANLARRVEKFIKKPYLDPKGFKRQSARRLMGTYRGELTELYERIAWHHAEADRLSVKSSSDKEREKLRKGKRPS